MKFRWREGLALGCCAAVGLLAALHWWRERFPCSASEAKRRQRAAAQALGVEVEETIDLGGGVTLTLVLIPPGRFLMGGSRSPEETDRLPGLDPRGGAEAFRSEHPQHWVTITKPFWLGKFEVTQAQYEKITGMNPAGFRGPNRPVDCVTWHDAQAFCRRLSELQGVEYRLPTEAEWEYACRAGSATEYYFGDSPSRLGAYAWFEGNADSQGSHPVGQKKPNAWGLHDMHGNVCEWCQDWYAEYTARAHTDPAGPPLGLLRVERGGYFFSPPIACRCADRSLASPDGSSLERGFRVARRVR